MDDTASENRLPTPAEPLAVRLNRAFGPVVAGILLDLLDFTTLGPIGLVIGLPVGAAAGYWMASTLGVEPKKRRWLALAAAVYCTIPFTEVLPLATLAGA